MDGKDVTIYGIAAPLAMGVVGGIVVELLDVGPIFGYRHGLTLIFFGAVFFMGGSGAERLHGKAQTRGGRKGTPGTQDESSRFGYEIPDQEQSTNSDSATEDLRPPTFGVGLLIVGILIVAI